MGSDWCNVFSPAARALLSGQSPYTVHGFYNPPWLLLAVAPLAWLPPMAGWAIFAALGLVALGWLALRLGGPVSAALILISPVALGGAFHGNVDWLALLGLLMPPRWGLFFVLIKPQVGSGLAVLWLVQSWREGGLRAVMRRFWPVSVAMALSFALFGLWPLRATHMPDVGWNAALWPVTLPVGAALLVGAVRADDDRLALASAPCLSPYLAFHSWQAVLLALAGSPWELGAAVAGMWAYAIMGG